MKARMREGVVDGWMDGWMETGCEEAMTANDFLSRPGFSRGILR